MTGLLRLSRTIPMTSTFLAPVSADVSLLSGETDGLAIDFTRTTYFNSDTYNQLWNQVRTASVDVYSSPHVYYANDGTSAKVLKTSTTGLGWSPHNIALQSQTFDNASWTKLFVSITANATTAPDGTATADKITADGTANVHTTYQSPTAVASVAYTMSIYVKASTQQFIGVLMQGDNANEWSNVVVDLTNGTITQASAGTGFTLIGSSITNVGSGWYRVTNTAIVGTGTHVWPIPTFHSSGTPTLISSSGNESITSSGEYFIWGAQINRGIAATAYLATTTAADIGLPISYGEGLWSEPAATNIALGSEKISDGTIWQSASVTTIADQTTAPDGASTADRCTIGSNNNNHLVLKFGTFFTTTSGVDYTFSTFVKADSGTPYVGVSWGSWNDGTKWITATFNLQTGVQTDHQSGAGAGTVYTGASITSIGSGWYRISITGQITDTQTYNTFFFSDVAVPTFVSFGSIVFTGNGTDSVFLWGFQVELGKIATSYIPTTTASAVRAKDGVFRAGVPASNTENTIYVDFQFRAFDYTTDPEIFSLDDGSANDQIEAWVNHANGRIQTDLEDGGAVQFDTTTNLATVANNTRAQLTTGYKANDFAASLDGAANVTDASGTVHAGMVNLNIGMWIGDNLQLNGFIRRLILVPRKVSNASLPTWRYNF